MGDLKLLHKLLASKRGAKFFDLFTFITFICVDRGGFELYS